MPDVADEGLCEPHRDELKAMARGDGDLARIARAWLDLTEEKEDGP